MVNAGFRKLEPYGFEIVHGPAAAILSHESASIENLQRIHSVGFFTNFRPVNLNANTCNLSKAVSRELVRREA